jgi:superfamily I DNA/RNA helicase
VCIRAVGRTLSRNFNLDRNYRNTREILELANLLVIPSGQDADDEEAHAFPTIAPEAAERTGPEPSLIACGSRTEENDQIVEWIQKLKEGRDGKALEESEIAVLYSGIGKNPGLRGPFLELLEKIGRVCDAPPYWITRDRQSQAAYRDDMPGVRVCTIHSAKGLEFPAVACPWTDQFPRPWVDDVPGERQLLYVAMTRACDHLLLTWSGELRPESLAALLAGSRGELITP